MTFIEKTDPRFNGLLDKIQKDFYHNSGGPDAEEVWSRHKREVKETGRVSFYTNGSSACNVIKRCRPGIVAVRYFGDGVEFLFDDKIVRPFHTLAKVKKD